MSCATFPGLLIIADDLSGAADCAADFASRVDTQVLLTAQIAALCPVVALDLDSRRLPAAEAAERHRQALQGSAFGERALYKKIDSTLRGNVASEVAALIGRGMAVVAPAFPAMQRTTRHGVQLLDGVAVELSDVWCNENLQGSSDLQALFTAQGLRTEHLPCSVMADRQALQLALRQALQRGVQAVVCDAENDEHLHNLAITSAPLYRELFWVGSAGLARHLPQALGLPESQALRIEPRSPVLTVVGSMSRHSQAQADQLATASAPHEVLLQPATLLDASAEAERDALRLTLIVQLAAGRDVLVRFDQQQRNPDQAADLSNALAQWLTPALVHVGSLIATGGETARAILLAAEIQHLSLLGELASGVVLSRARLAGRSLNVVTKAGGFGDPTTLLNAWRALHQPQALVQPFTEEAPHV